jgi:hypothetical protein
MRHILLAATFLAGSIAYANAKCTPQAPIGNIQPFQCDSDNQAADADDVKLFLDKATGVSNIDGSLIKNTSLSQFQNIRILTDAPINQEGNGFAELHSANAGSTANALHKVTFDPILPSKLDPSGKDFFGFDGFFGRGQVDPLGGAGKKRTWDGDVFIDITFVGGATQTLEFLGDKAKDDIGAIGFDELKEPGLFVDSVTMRLDATGAWNEVKQFEFSVPGASPVPEASTWAMLGVGAALMAGLGLRRRGARYAL